MTRKLHLNLFLMPRGHHEAAWRHPASTKRALTDIEPRFIDVPDSKDGDDGTKLFTALSQALADVPPERLAGIVMLTDGVVHDIPATLAQLGIKAPLHVLVTGHPDERDRQIKLLEAPRFGIVGKDQTIAARVIDSGEGAEPVTVTVRRDGNEISALRATPGVVASRYFG